MEGAERPRASREDVNHGPSPLRAQRPRPPASTEWLPEPATANDARRVSAALEPRRLVFAGDRVHHFLEGGRVVRALEVQILAPICEPTEKMTYGERLPGTRRSLGMRIPTCRPPRLVGRGGYRPTALPPYRLSPQRSNSR